jgi:hypothetical protein
LKRFSKICIWEKKSSETKWVQSITVGEVKIDVFVSRGVPSLGEGRKNRGNPD